MSFSFLKVAKPSAATSLRERSGRRPGRTARAPCIPSPARGRLCRLCRQEWRHAGQKACPTASARASPAEACRTCHRGVSPFGLRAGFLPGAPDAVRRPWLFAVSWSDCVKGRHPQRKPAAPRMAKTKWRCALACPNKRVAGQRDSTGWEWRTFSTRRFVGCGPARARASLTNRFMAPETCSRTAAHSCRCSSPLFVNL